MNSVRMGIRVMVLEDFVKSAQVEKQMMVVVKAPIVMIYVPMESFGRQVSVRCVLMGDIRLVQQIVAKNVRKGKVPSLQLIELPEPVRYAHRDVLLLKVKNVYLVVMGLGMTVMLHKLVHHVLPMDRQPLVRNLKLLKNVSIVNRVTILLHNPNVNNVKKAKHQLLETPFVRHVMMERRTEKETLLVSLVLMEKLDMQQLVHVMMFVQQEELIQAE